MYNSFFSIGFVGRKLKVFHPLTIVLIAVVWLTFACALPLHQVREERRRAHPSLTQVLSSGKADQTIVLAAFERANKDLDAAASGPCLLLAFVIIFLVNQLIRLNRRYNSPNKFLLLPHPRGVGVKGASQN